MELPEAAPTLAIAAGNLRHQAARIHGVDGHVGAVGGVGGGAQLRAIVLAGLRDAAGELDHRFFAGDFAQQVGHRFERGQLAVGVEDVELGIVGGEGRVGVFGDGGFDSGGARRRPGRPVATSLPGMKRVHGAIEQIAIVGEVGDDVELVAKGHHAHQVGAGSSGRAGNFLAAAVERVRSCGCREVRSKKSTIMRRSRTCWRNLLRGGDGADGDGHRRGVGGFGVLDFFDVVIVEGGNLLFVAVFGDGELILPQALDGLAVAVGDLDVDLDQVRRPSGWCLCRWRRLAGRRPAAGAGRGLLRILRQVRRGQQQQRAAPEPAWHAGALRTRSSCCSRIRSSPCVMMSIVRIADGADHAPEGRGVHDRRKAGEIRRVREIGNLPANVQAVVVILAEGNVLAICAFHVNDARAFDGVARGIAELAGRGHHEAGRVEEMQRAALARGQIGIADLVGAGGEYSAAAGVAGGGAGTSAVKGVPVCARDVAAQPPVAEQRGAQAFLREAVTVANGKFVRNSWRAAAGEYRRRTGRIRPRGRQDSAPRWASRRRWSWHHRWIFRRCRWR